MAKGRTRIVMGLLVLLVLSLVIAVIVISVKNGSKKCKALEPDCSKPSSLKAEYTRANDLYRDLTEDEIIRVREYVLKEKSLNVVPQNKASVKSNYIYLIELQNPDKDEAIDYLDNKGQKPVRAANVIIFRGAETPPYVEEILVYLDKPMKHKKNDILTDRTIPFNARPMDQFELKIMDELISNFSKKVHKIMKESYDGYTFHDCTDRCLSYRDNGPGSIHRSGERRTWIWFLRNVPGWYLHPVGLEILIQREGPDASKWKIEKIYYNKKLFDTVENFTSAYDNGGVKKIKLPAPTADELEYSSLKVRGEKLQPSQPLREPQQYEPDGKRYTADENHVEYMGWSFDFRIRTSFGPQLFDIRFNGERIVYELSVQEAIAFYGGYSPMQSYTGYLDSTWSLGAASELVKGVDCPDHATYFDTLHYVFEPKPRKRRNAICVFEHNTGIPLHRHFDNDYKGSYNFYGGAPGTALIVRTILTPYNYDYIVDHIFHPNGVIQAKISTSGYVQSTFWTPEENDYATEIHKNVAGSVHDHLFHFKVDLDVGGRKNSYETVSVKVENISSKWFQNTRHIQKRLERVVKKTEKDSVYKFDFKRPCYLNFFNPNKKNKQGVKRGYRVQLNGIVNQLYPENWEFTNGFDWSFYQMVVTKYKKNEDRSSSIYNQNDLYKPIANFSKFFADDENIENEDLVSWISVGLMHIPHSEDVPITALPGNNAGFFIRPFNFFDEDPSMASRDGVLITPTADGSKVDRGDRPSGSSCVAREKPINYYGRHV